VLALFSPKAKKKMTGDDDRDDDGARVPPQSADLQIQRGQVEAAEARGPSAAQIWH